nr:hypothetical protein [Candidatus Sigynarchaeum springense]MDO8115984.1 hypothetical protein [Candidatus Sigynarchaeota archaeon]
MAKCSQCSKEIDKPVISIAGSIIGDEYIDSYYFCSACQVYTKEGLHDRFCGEESSSTGGPLTKAEGDAKVKLIKRCPTPWDKRCHCPVHKKYFGPSLD